MIERNRPWDDAVSKRTQHGLYNTEINTIDCLCSYTEQDLKNIPNLGRKSINEIKSFLHGIGRKLEVVDYSRVLSQINMEISTLEGRLYGLKIAKMKLNNAQEGRVYNYADHKLGGVKVL